MATLNTRSIVGFLENLEATYFSYRNSLDLRFKNISTHVNMQTTSYFLNWAGN